MGIFTSKQWNGMLENTHSSSPPCNQKYRQISIDPRSPSESISRTPIQVEQTPASEMKSKFSRKRSLGKVDLNIHDDCCIVDNDMMVPNTVDRVQDLTIESSICKKEQSVLHADSDVTNLSAMFDHFIIDPHSPPTEIVRTPPIETGKLTAFESTTNDIECKNGNKTESQLANKQEDSFEDVKLKTCSSIEEIVHNDKENIYRNKLEIIQKQPIKSIAKSEEDFPNQTLRISNLLSVQKNIH